MLYSLSVKVSQGELDLDLFMRAMHQIFIIAAAISIIAAIISIARDDGRKAGREESGLIE